MVPNSALVALTGLLGLLLQVSPSFAESCGLWSGAPETTIRTFAKAYDSAADRWIALGESGPAEARQRAREELAARAIALWEAGGPEWARKKILPAVLLEGYRDGTWGARKDPELAAILKAYVAEVGKHTFPPPLPTDFPWAPSDAMRAWARKRLGCPPEHPYALPPVPADSMNVSHGFGSDACGAWRPGNGRVAAEVAERLVYAGAAYRQWQEDGASLPRERRHERGNQTRERLSQWAVGLWATTEKWDLPFDAIDALEKCLGGEMTSSEVCKAIAAQHSDLVARTWTRKNGKRLRTTEFFPDRPPSSLVRWARRHLECGFLPKKVPPAPAVEFRASELQERSEVLLERHREYWQAYKRRDHLAAIQTAHEAGERRAAEVRAAALDRFRAAQQRLLLVKDESLVDAAALALARFADPPPDFGLRKPAMPEYSSFRTRSGRSVELTPRVAQALPDVEAALAEAAADPSARAALSTRTWDLVYPDLRAVRAALISALATRDPPALTGLTQQILERAQPVLAPDVKALAWEEAKRLRAEAAARARKAAQAEAARQAWIEANRKKIAAASAAHAARMEADAARRRAAYAKAQREAQASMEAWRARQPPAYTGMSAAQKRMHAEWTRSRNDKLRRQGIIK